MDHGLKPGWTIRLGPPLLDPSRLPRGLVPGSGPNETCGLGPLRSALPVRVAYSTRLTENRVRRTTMAIRI